MAVVDVVVVSYNSSEHLRGCVEPLTRLADVEVIVVDNASSDASLDSIANLPVRAIPRRTNAGFATGCNTGWRIGSAPFVLFLNPDARIDESSLRCLIAVLRQDEHVGAVAPRIEHNDGSLAFSQRRFPTIRSTYAQALFLHRLFPRARWSDEIIRDPKQYAEPQNPEWVSGACILIRRSALEQLDGWDEGYFLYCEDIDICRRLRRLNLSIRFEPDAVALHSAGESAPPTTTIPLLAASRVRYARMNRHPRAAMIERIGIGLGAVTHMVVSHGGLSRAGLARRLAHARALRIVASRRHEPPAPPLPNQSAGAKRRRRS